MKLYRNPHLSEAGGGGFISKILRHSPLEYGIILDDNGYCPMEELLLAIRKQDYWSEVKISDIEEIVRTCEKQRFELKGDLIRARYGYSFQKLLYPVKQPPDILFHGTATHFLPSILNEGLKPMSRQYVHLYETIHFASLTGKRHGELVLLKVDAKKK